MIYSLDRVSKLFPQRRQSLEALRGVTLQVNPGEQIALLGQSGAGKTTLFRLLNATLRPSAGSLVFDGRDTSSLSAAELRAMRRRVGTIYQQHNLVPSLTAFENTLCGALGRMSFFATLRGMFQPGKSDSEFAVRALELVGLADKRSSRADELSGGQQQRLAVARVLMQSPDVILADEPTASLDPELAETMTSLLSRLATDAHKTLIMAVHKVDLATRYFPRVIGLRAGGLSFDVPSSEIRDDLLASLYARNGKPAGENNVDHLQHKLRCG
ncbi:MAG TPA: phosphonate ABC transporter ATP-binding protein [Candidatus Binatia bacterium]|nr:phosphonate ABC transporter ATP-binding protein [Candidatus Binatia bacterium]